MSGPRLAIVVNFFPRNPLRYAKPRRITASYREQHVYRWLVFNFAPKGWPK